MTAIEIHALGLTIGPFVPIKPHPFHAFDNGLDGFVRRSTLIRVFNAEDEDAFLLAGKEPIEQRRADASDVEKSSGARRESDTDLCHDWIPVMFSERRYLYSSRRKVLYRIS